VGRETIVQRLRHLDLYALLEIQPLAASEEIRRAYRRGALLCHPDKHPNDQQAAARFVLLTQARDVLLNPEARIAYDRLRARYGETVGASDAAERRPRRRTTRRTSASDPLNEQRLADRARRSRSVAELLMLWQKGTVVVRAAVLRNPLCPVTLCSEPCVEAHWMLSLEAATRPQCPPAVLSKLACSFERSVAVAVAVNPHTPAEALQTIAARHRDLPILCAVAAHQNASAAVLCEVGRAVRGPRSLPLGATIIAHPACPIELAERIRTRLGNLCA